MTLAKGVKIIGEERAALTREWRTLYDAGHSIRAIAETSGRSYGFVRQLIAESGADIRPRGGRR